MTDLFKKYSKKDLTRINRLDLELLSDIKEFKSSGNTLHSYLNSLRLYKIANNKDDKAYEWMRSKVIELWSRIESKESIQKSLEVDRVIKIMLGED